MFSLSLFSSNNLDTLTAIIEIPRNCILISLNILFLVRVLYKITCRYRILNLCKKSFPPIYFPYEISRFEYHNTTFYL